MLLKGKIDLIKLILSYIDQPFEDIHVHANETSTYQSLSPFSQLPLLLIDEEHRLCHDLPICRYLAEVGGLRGSNATEAATCDMIVEQLRACIDKATTAKSAGSDWMFIVERTLIGLEKLISLNHASTAKFVVGGAITWADLAMVNAWEWLINDYATRMILASRFPLIKEHNDFVRGLPAVDEWFRKQKPLGKVKNV